MNERDEKAAAFLSALITESDINRPEKTITGKSVEQIIEDSHFLSNQVRCVCGIQAGNDDLIQCPMCSMYLHRKCVKLPPDFDESLYVCPFCMFQHYSIDPLARLGNVFDTFNFQISSIYMIFKKLETLEKQTKQLCEELSKPGLSQSQRIIYDEKYRQLLSEITTLNTEWKEKINIVKAMQMALHGPPQNAQTTN